MSAIVRFGILGWVLWAACGSCPARPASEDLTAEQLSHLFDYDDKVAVDLNVTRSTRDDSGATVQDLTYDSPKGGRVPAFLVFPQKAGKYPAVVFVHWDGGNRTSFLPEALALCRLGVVSLLVEAPFARPTEWRKDYDYTHPEADRDMYVQAVVDVRRGIDLLASRDYVNAGRIAYVGHGFGGHIGALLAAIEPRITCATIIAGPASYTKIVETSAEPAVVEMKADHSKHRLERYVETMGPIDAVNYAGRASIPMLFQFGRYDSDVPEAMVRALYDAVKGPKEIKGYMCGHEVNDPAAARDRDDWLADRLGFRKAR